jgi:hypothetical protein
MYRRDEEAQECFHLRDPCAISSRTSLANSLGNLLTCMVQCKDNCSMQSGAARTAPSTFMPRSYVMHPRGPHAWPIIATTVSEFTNTRPADDACRPAKHTYTCSTKPSHKSFGVRSTILFSGYRFAVPARVVEISSNHVAGKKFLAFSLKTPCAQPRESNSNIRRRGNVRTTMHKSGVLYLLIDG